MAQKIAAVDAEAMNSLFVGEMNKRAGNYDTKQEGPTPANSQAFTDHKEYLDTLESVLSEDKKDGSSANDTLLD